MNRVLFVDDDPHILSALERMMALQDHWDAYTAKSGLEALEFLEEQTFDVVVSDMRMPAMDGAELLGRILERWPRVVRIVLSGYTELSSNARTIPVAQQWLDKPCRAEHLCEVLDNTLRFRTEVDDRTFLAALGRIAFLPLRPVIGIELLQIVGRPGSTAHEVAKILERDPGLAAKFLQLANSAFVGARHKTTSLQSAVARLGFSLVRDVVLAAEVLSVTGPDTDSWSLVEASVVCARLASYIAGGGPKGELASTATVLRDLGRPVLRLCCPAEERQANAIAAQRGLENHVAEREVLGFTHAEAGGYLLALWGIPTEVVEAVTLHHTPWKLEGTELSIAGAVHVAEALLTEGMQKANGQRTELSSETCTYLAKLGLEGELPRWRLRSAQIRSGTA